MKLSEKGLGKLYNSKACYYDDETEEEVVALSYFEHVFEFEADDFEPEPKKEPTVELTLDEAKEFKSYFDFVCNGMSISDSMWGEVHYLRNKIWGALNRSEQANGN